MLAHPIHGSIIYLSAETKGIKKKSEERVTQILMNISGLKKELREGENREQIKEKMRKYREQIKQIKQAIRKQEEKQSDIYQECSKCLEHIISRSAEECPNQNQRRGNQNDQSISDLNQQILHFLLFRKKFESAEKYLETIQKREKASNLFLAQYKYTTKFFSILQQILLNELDELTLWVNEHSNFLKKNGCKLQFKLIVCKFIKTLNTQGETSALAYLRTASSQINLNQQEKSEIQKLTFTLLQNQNQKNFSDLEQVDLKKIYLQSINLFNIFKQEQTQPSKIAEEDLPIIDPPTNSEEIGRLTQTLTQRTLALIQLIQRFGAQGREDFLETLTNNERIGLQLRAAITQMRRNTVERENEQEEGEREGEMQLIIQQERQMERPVNVEVQTQNLERDAETQVDTVERVRDVGVGQEREDEKKVEGEETKKKEEEIPTQFQKHPPEKQKLAQEEQYPQDFQKYEEKQDQSGFQSQPTEIPSLPQQSCIDQPQPEIQKEGTILNQNKIVKHLKDLFQAFLQAFSQVYRVPTETLLDKVIGMGIMALKTHSCHQNICKFSEKLANCPVCTKQITVIAKKVPVISHHQSSLICRINGSLMNHEDNNPLLLPNGQIYSESGLQSMKKKGKYKCLISGNYYRKEECRKVYLI